jgi:acetyltransferase
MGELRRMLNPKTIAFIGADDREGSAERSILDNLLSSKETRIWAVNPHKDRVLGIECRASISDVNEHINLAVITVPYNEVLRVIEECGKIGVDGALILSSCPQGSSEEERDFERKLWKVRKDYGMRLIGPGSNGIILPHVNLNATFLKADLLPGTTAFISQSGTIGSAMLYWGTYNRIGFSMFASLGSMVDVDYSDLIDFLQDDYFTKSIMLYVEHIKDAKKFISASRYFARNKPLIVLKPGRHPESTDALVAHTGFETGSDAVYDAVFRRTGMVRVRATNDFFDTAKVLVSRSLPRGPRLAVVTNSGGIGIIVCDTLAERKGQLAALSEKSMKKLDLIVPFPRQRSNPIDLSGDADVERYVQVIDVCLKDSGVDGILIINAPSFQSDPEELAKAVVGLAQKTAKPIIAVWMGGEHCREGIGVFRGANVPVYETPEDAVRAYLYMVSYRRGIEILNETPEQAPEHERGMINHLKVAVRNAVKERREALTAVETDDFLKNFGIPLFKERDCAENEADQDRVVDEWALRSFRDIDFGTVILLISMTGKRTYRSGFAVALPPLNRVLARRLMEDAEFPTADKSVAMRMEEVLISFANLIVDFPEISEAEIECVVTAQKGIYAKNATIQVDIEYRKGIAHYPHLSIMPYPSRYTTPWKIRDGRDVLLRPIRAEDEPLIREMLSSLSEETLRVRFFVVMEIDHRILMQFCNIDYDREIEIIAELKEDGVRRILGGGRLIVEPDSGSGQFAVLVHDEFQKQGLGEKLLDMTIGIAQGKGLKEIYGIVLTENEKMLKLSRKMGFKPTKLPDGITRVSLALD